MDITDIFTVNLQRLESDIADARQVFEAERASVDSMAFMQYHNLLTKYQALVKAIPGASEEFYDSYTRVEEQLAELQDKFPEYHI